jgi:hypothetical protein
METDEITETARGLRALRVRTTFGDVDGWLQTSPILRTLDDLNATGRDFLVLCEPGGDVRNVQFRGGRLAVNKSSILFVSEKETFTRPNSAVPVDAGLFSRAAIALWIGDYQVSGFVHVPRGAAALRRLNQLSDAFIAVTSASVTGPDFEQNLPFVAVNRARILAVEDLLPDPEALGDLAFDLGEPLS